MTTDERLQRLRRRVYELDGDFVAISVEATVLLAELLVEIRELVKEKP